jgi:multiple sugar transport system substrate-binding protein
MVTMPTHPGAGVSAEVVSSQMFSVSTSSAHPEAAAQFLDFWLNSVEANIILNGERGVPIMEHVRAALAPLATPEVAAINNFVSDVQALSEYMGYVLNNPRQGEIEDFINDVIIDSLYFGILTPEQAAQNLFNFASDVVSMN